MILLTILFIVAATFFAALVAFRVFSKSYSQYKERYLATSLSDLSDMFLFVDNQQLALVGVGLCILGAVSGFILSPVLAIVLGVFGLFSPPFLVKFYRRKRIEKFEHQLPDALQGIAGAMRSGLTFRQAMIESSHMSLPPLSQEFALFSRELQLGQSIDEALDNLAARVNSQEFELVKTAAQIALKVGGNLSEMLEKLSSTLRERFRIEGRIKTLTSQGKLQGIIIGFMPIVVWLGFDFFRPDLTRPMLTHWFGFFIIGIVVVMEICGLIVIRRMIKIEL